MNTPAPEPGPDTNAMSPVPPVAQDVKVQLRRLTRRGLGAAAVAVLGGYGVWKWITTRPADDGLSWPLRKVLEANERVSRTFFDPARLAPEFPRDRARSPRVNGVLGLDAAPIDQDGYRLTVAGGTLGEARRELSIEDLKALPRFEHVTELKCIEGWSTVVRWAGARLADLAATTGLASRGGKQYEAAHPPGDVYEYVSLATPDGGYYVGLDTPSAFHPQTLLCYEMNGQPLTAEHGAPVRLVIPVKYGIKNIKRIGSIRFTDNRPADYWAEQGYDWYAGH